MFIHGKQIQENLLNYKDNINTITTVAWDELYKKSLWKNIKYPKGKIHEDEFVIHYLLHNSKKVVYTNLKLYYYYQRDNSIMNSKFKKERLVIIEAFRDRWQFYKEKKEYKHIEPQAYCAYMKMIISNYFFTKENNLKEEQKRLLKIYKKDFKIKIKIGTKERIKLLLFYICPNIYCGLKYN